MISKKIKSDKLKDILCKFDELEVGTIYSNVASLLLCLLSPASTLNDIKSLIESDPLICARLIKRANSSKYSPRRIINSLETAIQWLGFKTIKDILLTQTVCQLFKDTGTFSDYSREKLWKHSLGVAIFCKHFYEVFGNKPSDVIYTSGLLHDIGIILIDQLLETQFKSILLEYHKIGESIIQIEEKYLNFNHQDLGYSLLRYKWNLPIELCIPIYYHHLSTKNIVRYKFESCVLYLADQMCQNNDMNYCNTSCIDRGIYNFVLSELNITQNDCDRIILLTSIDMNLI